MVRLLAAPQRLIAGVVLSVGISGTLSFGFLSHSRRQGLIYSAICDVALLDMCEKHIAYHLAVCEADQFSSYAHCNSERLFRPKAGNMSVQCEFS